MKLYELCKTLVLEDVPNQNFDDLEHDRAREETGYWGNQGSGALIISLSTGRILLPFRSKMVEEPHTWGGTWGGAIDSGEDPKDSAKREVQEESGYSGAVKMIPLNVYEDNKDNEFKYFNYMAVVPEEYKPRLNWETEKAEWFEYDSWPSPMHFGLTFILNDPQATAKIQYVASRNSQ